MKLTGITVKKFTSSETNYHVYYTSTDTGALTGVTDSNGDVKVSGDATDCSEPQL